MRIKSVLAILLTAVFLLAAGCAAAENDGIPENTFAVIADDREIKDTPNRIGVKGDMFASFIGVGSLENAIDRAELIADVTIVNWLGDSTGFSTTFQAQVNSIFKGADLFEESENNIILLSQIGGSEYTVCGYPLFKIGIRMLLFLRKEPYEYYDPRNIGNEWMSREEYWEFVSEIYSDEYLNSFWIVGGPSSVIDIQEYDGSLYLRDRYNILTENIDPLDEDSTPDIIEKFKNADLLFDEQFKKYMPGMYARNKIMAYDEVVSMFSNSIKERSLTP